MMAIDVIQQHVLVIGRENLALISDSAKQMVDAIYVDLGGVGVGAYGSYQFLLEGTRRFLGEAGVREAVEK
jgi:hypothetical protein